MDIRLRSDPVSKTQGIASTITINKPGGAQPGDVLLFRFYGTAGTGVNRGHGTIPSSPGGSPWTEALYAEDGTLGNFETIMQHVVDGTEPATIVFTALDGGTGIFMGDVSDYVNVDTTTPMDVAPTSAFGTGTNIVAASITPVTLGGRVVYFFQTGGSATTVAPPSTGGYDTDLALYGTAGDFARSAAKRLDSLAATGTVTAVSDEPSTGQWAAATVYLRPKTMRDRRRTRIRAGDRISAFDIIAEFDTFKWFRLKPPPAAASTPVAAPDAGAGTEAHSVTAAVPAADSGAGSEAHSTTGSVTAADSGAGTEAHSVTIPQTTTDSGAGSETTTTTGAPTSSESGAGTESHSVTALSGSAENGAGSEATSTLAVVGPSDAGSGSESTTTTGSVPAADSGAGSEAHSVTAQVIATASGTGTEASSNNNFTGTSDSATGSEAHTTTGAVTASDAGTGTETVVVTIPGTPATPTCADSGTGTESTSIVITGVIPPGGVVNLDGHFTNQRIRRPFVGRPHGFGIPQKTPEFSQKWTWSDDHGHGAESTVVTALIATYDGGIGWAFPQPPAINIVETSHGTTSWTIEKFEDPDSELKTIIMLAKAGAFHDGELAILLLENAIRRTEEHH